jgi:hypothetical protein
MPASDLQRALAAVNSRQWPWTLPHAAAVLTPAAVRCGNGWAGLRCGGTPHRFLMARSASIVEFCVRARSGRAKTRAECVRAFAVRAWPCARRSRHAHEGYAGRVNALQAPTSRMQALSS